MWSLPGLNVESHVEPLLSPRSGVVAHRPACNAISRNDGCCASSPTTASNKLTFGLVVMTDHSTIRLF